MNNFNPHARSTGFQPVLDSRRHRLQTHATKSLLVLITLLAGCAHQPPATTRPSIATTQPSYWLAQPASVHISSPDFNRLWKSCEEAARSYGFSLDRQDYRDGVLTTMPLISKQWFEVWRDDVLTPGDLANSSINAFRRTIHFTFRRQQDGTFDVTPAIVIERQVIVEHPIAASVYLRNAFRDTLGTRLVGNAEADEGLMYPGDYWYATGRDTVLEKAVAKTVEHWMKKT